MEYLQFTFWFTAFHILSYVFAGAIALKISGDLYKGEARLLDFIRDMDNEREGKYVQRYFIPAQIIRGILMSIVFYPILGVLGSLSFIYIFLFIAGLMFLFTDFASAIPFVNNIEGFVYMEERYLKKDSFWKLYFETIIYSLVFALLVAWFLF